MIPIRPDWTRAADPNIRISKLELRDSDSVVASTPTFNAKLNMSLEEEETENVFSYGTLQDSAVQLATFGRRLEGKPDALVGYTLRLIRVTDQSFVSVSGSEYHRTIEFTGVATDQVEGTVLMLTKRELGEADAYELPVMSVC